MMRREAARVALAAYRPLYPDAREAGGALVLRSPAAPDSPMVNRIVGLGVDRTATEHDVDEALAAMGDDVTCYVALAPDAEPAHLPAWLEARGLEAGWGWMLFRRDVTPPPPAPTTLELVEVTSPEQTETFARVVCAGYGLPDATRAWVTRAVGAGWTCWLALAGDEPAAAAGLYVDGGAGYLGFAATVPEHRCKGAQGALLAARLERARELGCAMVVTETGERRDDRPEASYRNILRAGFEEIAVTANWLRPKRSG